MDDTCVPGSTRGTAANTGATAETAPFSALKLGLGLDLPRTQQSGKASPNL